jgi:hypothetical protein
LNRTHFTKQKILATITLLALVILFSSLPQSAAASDQPQIEWRQTFSGIRVVYVIQTCDGGYALAGELSSASGVSFIKTDATGNIQWQKNFGNIVSLAQTSDLGYVVFCENGNIIKMDSQGNINSTFSVGSNKGVKQGILTDDGDYVVVGNAIWQYQETYVWLRKYDTSGNILWDLNYTGGFHVLSIANTVDRGVVLGGNWKNNFWLAKLDSNGNQQWSQNYVYGDPEEEHYLYSVARTSDGGFILSGTGDWQSSGGLIPWMIKINSQGYEQWNLPYAQYHYDSFSSVVQVADNGYFIVRSNAGSVMGADSSGSELWQLSLGTSAVTNVLGSPADCIIAVQDGGCVIAGSTDQNSFLVKTSPQMSNVAPIVGVLSPEGKTYDTNNLPLTVKVNSQGTTLSYFLDGKPEVIVTGNVTLTDLASGAHNITVYARNSAGQVGTSQTVTFTVADRFLSTLLFAGVAVGVTAAVGCLLYFKRQTLANIRKREFKGLIKNRKLGGFTQNKLIWTLSIIVICFLLVFVQFFAPYYLYANSASLSKNANSTFEVGVTYVYERDSVDQIYGQVSHLKDLGFSVIRVNLVCDSGNANNVLNTLSDTFFSATRQLKVKVALIINEHTSTSNINYHLNRWGSDLTYIQILNEPDVASSWDVGALFTDDEAGSKFEDVYTTVEAHHLSAQLYTNFSPAFVARTNLPIEFSKKLDFVGFDVFMDSFLTISPNMIQYLEKITNKQVVISEFGMTTSSDKTQSDYIINGLNLFHNMGLRGCWIVYWNDDDNHYGIRGRLAEQQVGEWIANNA